MSHDLGFTQDTCERREVRQFRERRMEIEITDEMVERAARKICENASNGRSYGCSLFLKNSWGCYCGYSKERVKCARECLAAGLNTPPPEPVIVVTDDMFTAGHNEWHGRGDSYNSSEWRDKLTAVYQAMRKLEKPRERPGWHRRSTDNPGLRSAQHSRKDD